MSVEAPPAPAEAEVETAAEVAVEATAESVADQPVTITETCDDAEFEVTDGAVTAEVLPPSLLSGEQLVLLYGKEYWLNPEYLAAYDRETEGEKERLLSAEDEIEDRLATLKTEVAEENAALKAARKRTKDYRRERRENKGKRLPARQLTIESALPPDARPAANADPGAEPVNFPLDVEVAQKKFFDDLSQKFPIGRWKEFGATDADIKRLHAGEMKDGGPCPIVTVGDLRRFVNPYPENPGFSRGYGDIKGLGRAATDRISDAELKFWAWWQGKGGAEYARELGLTPPQPTEKADVQEQRAGDEYAAAVPGGGVPADDQGAE